MEKAIIFDWTGTLYERNKGLFDFTEGVLKKLKPDFKLGLISKANDSDTRKLEIKKSGIKNYFDYVSIVNQKGEKEFKDCMNELKINKPENILVVDDRMSRGIVTGKNLGCKTYWIQIGDRSFDSPTSETGEPDYKINSIKELTNLI